MPVEFLLFGATLLCVALFHQRTLLVASVGLSVITAYKLLFSRTCLRCWWDSRCWRGISSRVICHTFSREYCRAAGTAD
jgi:hypothetical protein